jgi:serine/threonine protein kinase
MTTRHQITPGMQLDGYELIRKIGEGGFGAVWLCRATFTGELKAIKIVSGEARHEDEQEFRGLVAYKEKALWMRSDALISVEHANAIQGEGFFYVMPLADSLYDGINPLDENWRPKTLAACIECFREAGPWFSSEQIRYLLAQLIGGAKVLEEAGLVHRDIKPENVIFLAERPTLADCGLVGPDKIELTRRGTPGYAAPRYYTESGGSPDMYSLGSLLYTLLTGRSPDSSNLSARRAYWWPPTGEETLSDDEKKEWARLRNVILTALDEEKRYVSLEAFSEAISGAQPVEFLTTSLPVSEEKPKRRSVLLWAVGVGALICAMASTAFFLHKARTETTSPPPPSTTPTADTGANTSPISPERMQQLDAIVREAQSKLDAYAPNFGGSDAKTATVKEKIEALGKIDAAALDADQQLDAFLTKYHGVRLPPPNNKNANVDLNELYSYVGRIYDWAKTDQEKEIAQIRAMDFNRKLTPLLNAHSEGQADSALYQVQVSTLVAALCTKRSMAATTRTISMTDQAKRDDENKRATDFSNKLHDWNKWVTNQKGDSA